MHDFLVHVEYFLYPHFNVMDDHALSNGFCNRVARTDIIIVVLCSIFSFL